MLLQLGEVLVGKLGVNLELLVEVLDGRTLSIMKALFIVLLADWSAKFRNFALKLVNDECKGGLSLVSANLYPCRLDVGYSSIVDGADVHAEEADPRFAVHSVTMNLLGWTVAKNLAAQVHHLLDKLGTKLINLHLFKLLKLVFINQGPNQSVTIPLREVLDEAPANLCLLVLRVRALLRQCLLQVVALSDFITFLVLKLQREISYNPHESRKHFFKLGFFFLLNTQLDVLGQIDDQRKARDGVLVDLAH